MSYFGAITQNVKTDTLNSSTSILTGSQTFNAGLTTGTSTLGVAGVQVNLIADQNCTIYIDQSMNNVNWDITDSFNYYFSLGGDSFTIQATASYIRVRVKNLSTNSTTYFRLQTVFCPIVEAIPRSLDTNGNFKTGIRSISSYMGSVDVSPMGSLKVAEAVRLAGVNFVGSILDTNFWISGSLTGSAAVTQLNGELILSTGVTTTGSISVGSFRVARYIPGSPNYYRGQITIPTAICITGSNTRRWGAFDVSDGYFFELQTSGSTPLLGIVSRLTGTDTRVTSFNGTLGSSYTVDTNTHTYELWWTNKFAYYFIDDILLHTITASPKLAVSTTSLRIGLQNTNLSGNLANNTFNIRSSTISRVGKPDSTPAWKNITGAVTTSVKLSPGRLHRVVCNNNANGQTITLYDALTATNPIGVITQANSVGPLTLDYDLDFYTGLTIVTVGAGVDVTVVYE